MKFNKKNYKQVQKLTMGFENNQTGDYAIVRGVSDWLSQHNIPTCKENILIIFSIFGTIPYVYVEEDRREIIEYLNTHDFKGIKQ